jgi:HPt (histidine-containing phosphotransfer) domain-containing protein
MLNFRLPLRIEAAAGNGVSAPPSSGPRHPPGLTLPTAGSVLDAEALHRLSELDPTGANHLLERVFQAFEASALRLLPQMHESLRSANFPGVRHVVHTLKSSSASIGAIKLSQLCAEIESMIRLETLDGIADAIERMDHETTAVLQALKQIRGVAS